MKLTEAEWQIMNALWENWPATARQIADRLPGDIKWAYTTIKTMLTRLTDKNAVKESKKGNVAVYEPILTRQNAQRSALKSLANQAFDGAFGPLMHFLLEDQKLSDKQKEDLLQALKTGEQKGEQE
ncbi:MAG: BlaI/MecI/CopY family transcriptional regulator [Phycisphaerae bacterium]|nr:BlaI/MecI/CopY family transcriptional regulator [Phycisphaerae bacterium]